MFDYDVNIRKIHEMCNKTYKKKTDLGRRFISYRLPKSVLNVL